MNTQEKLTTGELETLKQLEQWIGEDNRFELPRPITNQLKGFCSSLQRKRLIGMYNGECYFDGFITEQGFDILNNQKNQPKKEKKELNLKYLLEETVKKAYEEKDCLFLARLVLRIIEENQDIKFNIDIKTLDYIICDRLAKTLDDIEYEESIGEVFDDVSEGVLKFLKFAIQVKKGGKL